MMKAIYFDMDGTIADLYSVENWLPRLRAEDPSPYTEARPLIDVVALKAGLDELRKLGYVLGVITWLSKKSSQEYKDAVRRAKDQWLTEHFGADYFDKVHMVQYGTPKHKVATIKDAILFDDNEGVRLAWKNGQAYDEKDILAVLNSLIISRS